MLNDLIPVIAELPVAEHPNGITLIPIGDAHYGSEEFNEVLWHKTIKRVYDDPHCFIVLVGDLLDFATKNSPTSVFQQTCSPHRQKEWLIEELSVVKDRILACVDGNHEKRGVKEVDQYALYDVMFALGKERLYRPNICFLAIRFMRKVNGKMKSRETFNFAITHGAGGGMYIGSSANKVERYGTYIDGIDGIVVGHTHRPVTFPVSKLVFDPHAKSVKQTQFVVAVASSFLEYGGYPISKMLPPTAHSTTEIVLSYTQDERKEIRVIQ